MLNEDKVLWLLILSVAYALGRPAPTHTHIGTLYTAYIIHIWHGKLFMVCHGELTTWLINSGT